MGFEASPPNEFRASLRPGGRGPLVVADKSARVDPSADGLRAVKVLRSEIRRTDQRGDDRHRLDGEQTLVRRNGKNHSVDLVNLSQGGAMVTGDFKAKLWDRVKLVLGEGGEVECAVRWIRDGKIGLEFAHETQIECDSETLDDLLRGVIRNSFPEVVIEARPAIAKQAHEHGQKRGASRHPLIWSGILHHDFEWQDVRLRNISATGALIECTEILPVGANVYLDLRQSGRIAARVNWLRGNQAGLRFAEPFDVASLSQSTPILASKTSIKSHFAPYGRDCDQSPWAPQWKRLSINELGAELGG
ncbi:MAG: PilZ domain-containing protein [Sphingomonas sp.]|nr:PilZ domain-containing protein [Sphingomonas sp.]